MSSRTSPRSQVSAVLPSKEEVTEEITRRYFWNDAGLTQIIRLLDPEREADPHEPIKLLEIHLDAVPSGVILPVGFPAHPESGRPYRTIVILIAPPELDRIRSGSLQLPAGWVLGAEYLPPTEERTGAG